MNVIIVAKSLRTPRKLSLTDPRVLAATFGFVVFLVGIGVGVGFWLRDGRASALQEVAAMRDQLNGQAQDLDRAKQQVDMELNAFGVRLGELQAQATRLNALGDRLTRLAQLEDGEFDFGVLPAMGGPEALDIMGAPADRSVRASLEALSVKLESQSRQLDVLETLLLDRDVETAHLPAGLPIRAGYASSGFGMRSDPFTARSEFHRGMDFNGAHGSEILAVADGVVTFSGRYAGYGNMVDIDHGNGYMTRYAHNDKNLVEPGTRVRAGDVVAKMGKTGRATGVHVHFEVWLNDRPVNPASYLKNAKARG
ncbi:M23 family metallopeptidase [Pseudomarimonas arenosa]|uniref:Peptidoglycan DD-metalloendopeptidase family protein n=1 Tax=Pseudomarimonas arenosa TaxID=2774145 RepID=A0AAW3ZLC2_9GAMM|nr:M23 family metallopeptidase [Pseudomarimonas arenosa]MBD8525464.1 peptidoglycan DD-metalloendopeptidase family protein [Pseudomarimonas arenosa]